MVFTYPHIGNVGINAGAPRRPPSRPLFASCFACTLAGAGILASSRPDAQLASLPRSAPARLSAPSFSPPFPDSPSAPPAACSAGDMESEQVHMGGVIVRDLSITVSNYRANMSLDEYLKQQKVGEKGVGCTFVCVHEKLGSNAVGVQGKLCRVS